MTVERKNNPELVENFSFRASSDDFNFNIHVTGIKTNKQYLEKLSRQIGFRHKKYSIFFYKFLAKKFKQNNIRHYWMVIKPSLQASRDNTDSDMFLHIYELNFRINIFMRHSDLNRLKLTDYNFYLWLNGRPS